MRLYRSCFHMSDPLNREEHTRQTPNVLRFRWRLRSWTNRLISTDTFLLPDTNPGPLGDWIRRAFDIQSSLLPRRLGGRFHHTPPPDRSSALRFNFPPLHFHPALVSRPAAAGRALLLLWYGAIMAAICYQKVCPRLLFTLTPSGSKGRRLSHGLTVRPSKLRFA